MGLLDFLGPIGTIANVVGKLFGTTEDDRNKARVQETQLNNTQDELALQRAFAEQGNSRANLAASDTARRSDEGAALKGGYLQGVQDYHVTRPEGVPDGHATGGLRPSAILGKEAIGKTMQDSANARIAANYPTLNTATPNLTPVPEANGFDKFLNIARGITGAISLAGNIKDQIDQNTDSPPIIDPLHPNTPLPTPTFYDPNNPLGLPQGKKPNYFAGGNTGG